MKNLLAIMVILGFLVSCKEDTTYELRILIKNETNSKLNFKLFPKSEYMLRDLYRFSSAEIYRGTDIEVNSTDECELFKSEDLKIEPNILTAQVFDSINVNSSDGGIKIKFSSNAVTGYPHNIYDYPGIWSFEVRYSERPTMLKSNPVESHDYIFTITSQ